MSTDIVIVFIFFAGPIRGYSPGGLVNNFYSHSHRGNSHFESLIHFLAFSQKIKPVLVAQSLECPLLGREDHRFDSRP